MVDVGVTVGVRVDVPVAVIVGVRVGVWVGVLVVVGVPDWVGVRLGVPVGNAAATPQPPLHTSVLLKTVFAHPALVHRTAQFAGLATPSAQKPPLQLPPPKHAQHIACAGALDKRVAPTAHSAKAIVNPPRVAVQVLAADRPAVLSM